MANVKGFIGGAAQGGSAGFAVAGPVGAVVGGLLGGLFGGQDRELTAEERAYINAQRELASLPPIDWSKTVPSLSAYKAIEVEEPVLQAEFPELKTALDRQMPPRDPREERMRLQAYESIRQNKGVQATELAKIQMQQAQMAKSGRDAIMQSERAKGTATGGQALAAQMAANQSAQNAAAMGGIELAGQKEAIKLDALNKYAQGLSQLRGERVAEAQALATAKDNMATNTARFSEVRKAENNRLLNERLANLQAQREKEEMSRVATTNEMARDRAALQEKMRNDQLNLIDKRLKMATGKAAAGSRADTAHQAGIQGVLQGAGNLADSVSKSDWFKNIKTSNDIANKNQDLLDMEDDYMKDNTGIKELPNPLASRKLV